MRLSTTQAAILTSAAALLLVPASASAQGTLEDMGGGYQPGANHGISGEAGYDNTLPSLEGDVYIEEGAPLEGEVWYFGHGGEYGADYKHFDHEPTERPFISRADARSIGRAQCDQFETNFGADRDEYNQCVEAVANAVQMHMTPRQACEGTSLSKTPESGEARRDFGACVAAGNAAKA